MENSERPKRTARRWTVTTYNPQAITPRRGYGAILKWIGSSIIGMQGTRTPPRLWPNTNPPRRKTFWQQRMNGYRIYHWTPPPDAAPNDARGVSLALKEARLPHHCVRANGAAEGKLQGRGGYLRITKKNAFDFLVLVLFFSEHKVLDRP